MKKIVSIQFWYKFYRSSSGVVIRHVIAWVLLFFGVLGLMLAQGAGLENVFILIGCLVGAALLDPEVSMIVIGLTALFAIATKLPVSIAIIMGSVIIAGAIVFINKVKKDKYD